MLNRIKVIKKIALTGVICCLYSLPMISFGADPGFTRVFQSLSTKKCQANDIAVSNNNIYMTGYFSDRVIIGKDEMTGIQNGTEIFIASRDNTGKFSLVTHAGESGENAGYAIAVDSAGNILVTGSFYNSILFKGSPDIRLTNSDKKDMFIAKFTPGGQVIWAKQAGVSTGESVGLDVRQDSSGNIYITGHFMGSAFSGGVVSSGLFDIFLAKYSADGNLEWVSNAGGSNQDEGAGIAIDSSGYIYLTGRFQGTADFDVITLTGTPAGVDHMFIAKYSPSGNVEWARQSNGNSSEIGYAIALNTDSVFVTGSFTGSGFSTPLSNNGGKDIFLAGFDKATGNLNFAVNYGSVGDDTGKALATDSSGNIVICGEFENSMTLGSASLVSHGGKDGFIAALNSNGDALYGFSAGGAGGDSANSVAINGNKMALAGIFYGIAYFGSGQYLASLADINDMFLTEIGVSFVGSGTGGDLSGNGTVGLEDALGILRTLSRQ